MKLLKKLLFIAFLCTLILLIISFGFYFITSKDVYLDANKLVLSDNNLLIYDQDGERIENVSAFAIKQTARIENIPKHTQLAFVNTEDKRFYTHNGFDIKRIAKALLNNVKSRSFKEGASTISQQLIKNTHLTQEKTIQRKLKEWKLTNMLEKKYSKDEILEKYLNSIYFGHSCFGIQAAAEFYFSKTPQELDLADSAILAGLIKSPNNYSPFKNPEKCLKRKAIVLAAMKKNQIISEEEYQEAIQKALPVYTEQTKKNIGYLSFVFDELSAIAEQKDLRLGGKIEIYTGLNTSLQAELERQVKESADYDKTMMVLDAKTNDFKACVSTVGNIKRLPGSLIKPLLVYAPALEENILSPATPILDEKINYGGYSPDNYDKTFNGYVSARECVAKSLNVPAVKVLQSLGVRKGISYLEKLNLSVEQDEQSLALALGGMKNGFHLRDLVSAYSAFPNEGILNENGFIREIKRNGLSVYKRPNLQRKIFSAETAYLMTDMLKTAVKTGTAKKLRSLPFDIAAKTGTVGTTNGNTDAYAISYTVNNVVGVWIGNADNTPIPHTGGGAPCQSLLHINEYLQQQYHSSHPIPAFSKPKNVEKIALDKLAYYDTHTMLLADDLAPKEYRLEEWFNVHHSPTKKSDFFSNPRISSPVIKYDNLQVVITLPDNAPALYQYKIERYDYVTHKTLYEGVYTKTFQYNDIEENKKYLYTITPFYHGKEGVSITLPEVRTKPRTSPMDEEMIEKEWWDY